MNNKYINIFATRAEYETYKTSDDFCYPNVAYLQDEKRFEIVKEKEEETEPVVDWEGMTKKLISGSRTSEITEITIPDSVTSIRDYAFYSCGLKSVAIPDSVTSIGYYAFQGNSISSVTIPDSVTSIGWYAFKGAITNSVTLSNSITEIPEGCFMECGFQKITIPDSVTSIGGESFSKSQLVTIVMGNSIEQIQSYAFEDCYYIKTLVINTTTPPSAYDIYDAGFSAIYVPDDAVDAYKTATNWNQIASKIKPISEYTAS